jgi:hypothetical protein
MVAILWGEVMSNPKSRTTIIARHALRSLRDKNYIPTPIFRHFEEIVGKMLRDEIDRACYKVAQVSQQNPIAPISEVSAEIVSLIRSNEA